MKEERFRVFVYGTLLSGEPNSGLLEPDDLIGESLTEASFKLVSLGAFPALVAGGSTAVIGELYEIGPRALKALDRLEGHPHFYHRRSIQLAGGSSALAYLLNPQQAEGRPTITSGDWRSYKKERR